MKQSILIAIAVCVLGVVLAAPTEAQEVQCLGCLLYPNGSSICQTYNGSWPDCTTITDGYVSACSRGSAGGRCRRGGDGTWYGFRVQDVFYMPLDRPFSTAYRVTRTRMTQRPA